MSVSVRTFTWRAGLALAALAALLASAHALDNVTVIRNRLSLEQLHTIVVDANTEYILDFIPNLEQSQWPARVWLSSDGGDTARPLLITYRQRAGAGTWQVPMWSDGRLLFEMERQLCPDDSVDDAPTDCMGPEESERARGWFSLHAVSACARALTVQLRAAPARDFRLYFQQPLSTQITLAHPRVHYYMFEEEQEQVRLVISSTDDICATITIQNYTCPIAETLADIASATIRMTVQRSGAVQLARSRFPRGFYVVSMAHENDEACVGEEEQREDWLWEAAVFGEETQRTSAPRIKRLTLDTRPALSRSQYVIAGVVTLAFFLAFYVFFGALVLLQRWPLFFKVVGPKAVLKDTSNAQPALESQVDATGQLSPRRRRRASDATFDSSDNSDSDETDDETPKPALANGDVTASPPANGGVTASPTANSGVTANPPANGAVAPSNGAVADVTTGAAAPGDVSARAGGEARDVTTSAARPGDVSARARDEARDVTARSSRAATAAWVEGTDPGRAPGADVVDGDIIGPDAVPQQSPTAPEPSRPYGLPAKLRVDALARRKARVIRARSDRYLQTLYTVAVFYALPVVQFVIAFQIVMNVSGSLDLCYYNFLCAHPAGQLSDFNHVFSNVGYLLLGALFMLQLRRRRWNRDRAPRDEEYGIPEHYGLLASLGAGMMMVALLSASYHVCPNRLNFQFDTAFMYVLSVLSMVKIYQSRHPDVNARAHATFGVLAVLIAIVVWGVLGGGALFWGVFTVLHVFTFLLLSLRIYYIGQFRFEKETFQWAARGIRALPAAGLPSLRPLYSARLVLLLIANAVNWAFALYGLFTQSTNFASHLLFVLLANTMVYILFYLAMKLLHGERPRWYSWCFLAGAAATWAPALYFFTSGGSSWSSTPAQSRHSNHECRVLQFYDSHDLWHMLSAIALYLTFNTMLTWDDGLAAVPRSEIAVF